MFEGEMGGYWRYADWDAGFGVGGLDVSYGFLSGWYFLLRRR